MPEVSDVELMQFADGALDPEQQAKLEVELRNDPGLRQRLNAFLVTGQPLARLFDPVVEAPVPDWLLAALTASDGRGAPAPSAANGAGAVLGRLGELLRESLGRVPRRFAPVVGFAALLCVALLAGGLFWALHPGLEDTLAGPASVAMGRALESTPSAARSTFVLADRGRASLQPIFSFRNRDGRYCRQYELALADGKGFAGFACRGAQGAWTVERDAPAEIHHDVPPDAITTAGQASVRAVEEAVGRVMVGDAIEKDRERALIEGGWRIER